MTTALINLKRTFGTLYRHNKLLTIGTLVLTVFDSLIPFLSTYLSAQLINAVIDYLGSGNASLDVVYTLFVFSLIVFFFQVVVHRFHLYGRRLLYQYWAENTSAFIYQKYSNLDFEVLDDPKFNTFLNRVKDGSEGKPGDYTFVVINFIKSFTQIIAASFFLLRLNVLFFFIILISLLPQLVISIKYSKRKWGIWEAKELPRKIYYNSRRLIGSPTNLLEMRVFNSNSYVIKKMKHALSSFFDEQRKIIKTEAVVSIGASLSEFAARGFVYYSLLIDVLNRILTIGGYTFYLGVVNRFLSSTKALFNELSRLYEDNLYMTDYYKFLDLKNNVLPGQRHQKPQKIIFKGVSFSYPFSKNVVLKDLDLQINKGEHIAIVGENGAGKTTLIKLLLRYYNVTHGIITVNDTPLNALDLFEYRSNISILFQDYIRYPYSIKENIALSSKVKDEKEFYEALQASGVLELIKKYKFKENQMLDRVFDSGVDLSAGEWQKIALARVLYRDSELLILDEPTSSLDAQSELDIFKKIKKLRKNKTTILISHRFNTVKDMDKIFVLDNKQIIEKGSHKELMKIKSGYYRKMYTSQFESYKK